VGAEKIFSYVFSYQLDSCIKTIVLGRVAGVVSIKEEKADALFCFYKPDQKFLQMPVDALIIA